MKKLLLLLAIGVQPAMAATVNVGVVDSGWYTPTGQHINNIENYIVRENGRRNFFVFDLAPVTENIVSAQFQLFTHNVTTSGDYTLYDVSTPINELVAGGFGFTERHTDLGSGLSYGDIRVLDSQDQQLIQIDLNAVGINALNASSGLFGIGGALTNSVNSFEFAFGNSQRNAGNQLILETGPAADPVPLPSGLGLLLIGLMGAVSRTRSSS